MATLTVEALRSYAAAGAIVKEIKREIARRATAGTPLLELAQFVEDESVRLGGRPAFPCNIAVGEIASHYTPHSNDPRVLCTGDLVKIDLGVIVGGYIADSAITLEIDTTRYAPLVAATERALAGALAAVRPGVTAGALGSVVDASARESGFRVLKGLYGHNLERDCLHGGLTIPNFDDGSRKRIREGDVIAVEPFLTPGDGAISRQGGGDIFQLVRRNAFFLGEQEKKLLSSIERNYNGFPFARRWLPDPEALDGLVGAAVAMEYPLLVERDGAPVAQAEHTVIVERDGCRIIT